MSKAKLTVTKPGAMPSPHNTAFFHTTGEIHGTMGTCYRVLAGLQLISDREALKTAARCSFVDWLDQSEAVLGFKQRHAFDLIVVAEEQKTKLSKIKDATLAELLKRAPATYDKTEALIVLNHLAESTGGRSLRLLRDEIKQHRAALSNRTRQISDSGGSLESDVQMQFNFLAQADDTLDETFEEGGEKILLLERWSETHLEDLLERYKRRVKVVVKILHAKKGGTK